MLKFFDVDRFFDKISVADEYGCGEEAILG